MKKLLASTLVSLALTSLGGTAQAGVEVVSSSVGFSTLAQSPVISVNVFNPGQYLTVTPESGVSLEYNGLFFDDNESFTTIELQAPQSFNLFAFNVAILAGPGITGNLSFTVTTTSNISTTFDDFVYTVGNAPTFVGFKATNGDAFKTVVVNGPDPFANRFYSAGFSDIKLANVQAVPEPETYAMFLAGLGLMSVLARRKQK